MSMSDSESSYSRDDYKNFRRVSRERLLHEMLRSATSEDSKLTWKVLIMDKLTVKIMSHSCRMADITDEGVTLVEDLFKRRQPLPTMDAIYFIQPTEENIIIFLSDMSGRTPLYRKAFIFFSSPISKDLIMNIRKDKMVLPRIGALREMNLEYFAIDSQGFITNNERALEELFGDEENNNKSFACLNQMACRIATVFASLREFPLVRYRAAKCLDAMTMTTFRDLIPTKLAAGVWDYLVKYKKTIPNFPQTETCDLLILDRSIDQIAPIIHEWTYDAMCHDLLNVEGNKYVHEVPGKNGSEPEKKEVLLGEHDPIWLELRHAHIADASERLHDKMTRFISKNKAAQIQHGFRDKDFSTNDLHKMVQALPQYSEQIDKLSLHVEIAGKINRKIRELELRELGQLEQDLVFGDAGMKDVIKFFTTNKDTTCENKMRLLMILAAIYPEKFEGEKGLNLMKVARLTEEDMIAVNNLRMIGQQPDTTKRTTSSFKFEFQKSKKKKRAARKDRSGEEETWQLARFYPIIEDLIDQLSKNELSREDYPCLNDPSLAVHSTTIAASINGNPPAHSMRSRRTPSWARSQGSDDGYASDSVLRISSRESKKMGRRIVVFIVGGATRSELRACHKLTGKLRREVILGSTSLEEPINFITKLKSLTERDVEADDIDIDI